MKSFQRKKKKGGSIFLTVWFSPLMPCMPHHLSIFSLQPISPPLSHMLRKRCAPGFTFNPLMIYSVNLYKLKLFPSLCITVILFLYLCLGGFLLPGLKRQAGRAETCLRSRLLSSSVEIAGLQGAVPEPPPAAAEANEGCGVHEQVPWSGAQCRRFAVISSLSWDCLLQEYRKQVRLQELQLVLVVVSVSGMVTWILHAGSGKIHLLLGKVI